MKPLILFAVLLLSPAIAAQAQLGRSALESIERHREPARTVPVMQSIAGPMDSTRRTEGRIATWDFLEEEDRLEDAADTASAELPAISPELFTDTASTTAVDEYRTNDEINGYIEEYVHKHGGAMRGIIGKYRYYQPLLEAAFTRHGLPEDLTALAIVESAMNPLARSRAGALGMWQFMPETARQYGLRCDETVDERLDPLRSADAAARYLADAYARYGSWALAITSYNCGTGRVDKAIDKAGSTNFWDIYPYLPNETKGYYPAYVAALFVLIFHTDYGIEPRPFNPGKYTNITVTKATTLQTISQKTGVPHERIKKDNPQYLCDIVPAGKRAYVVKIPNTYE